MVESPMGTCQYKSGDRTCQEETHPGSTSWCILHEPDASKDRAAFLKALRDRVDKQEADNSVPEVDLTGVFFPPDFRWANVRDSSKPLAKGVSFRYATFTGDASFERTIFTGDDYFTGAIFTGNAYFTGAIFTGNAYFRDTNFGGAADFGSAAFSEVALFRDATFTGNADFTDATFTGNADFRRARFTGDAELQRVIFAGNADFRSATFTGFASFRSAKFKWGATFWGANFWLANFSGNVYFGGATFFGNANFARATFTGAVGSWDAVFSGNVYFWRTTFIGDTYFRGTHFTQAAHFGYARFAGNADLDNATFTGNADFGGARFEKGLRFVGTTFPQGNGPGVLTFVNVTLERPERVYFQDVDLSRTSFLGTDLRQVHFINVRWAKLSEGGWPPWRPLNVLYDDPRVSGERDAEEADYHQAAELYRQLRVNLEENRQSIEAGDFYAGQMDMRRHDTHFGRLYRGLLSLYRFAALYGESYWRPLILYIVLAGLLFAPLYLSGGFRGATEAYVHRPVWAGTGALWDWAFWGDYLQAAYLALTAGVPFRAELHVVSPWVVGPYFLNALVNILLLALAVIALRRQFKR